MDIIRNDRPSQKEQSQKSSHEQRLIDFIRNAWPVLEPTTPFVPGKHLEAIAQHLEAITKGQISNLLINMPPRHMKSLAVSVFWPAWEWITFPQRRWLYASYALSLSIRDSLKCRRLIESPWYQSLWGDHFRLTGDQNTKHRFENDKTGCRLAVSVGGSATGEGGDRVVVDDPHNVAERESDAIRQATLTWWDETMSTRLNDPKTGTKVIVMQRVHEKDLSGHVLEQGGYVHLCLPAEFDPARKCSTSIWTDSRNAEGDLLWPDRIGHAEIADFKLRLGPSGYAGQFQQLPAPAGGARFKQDWFLYYTRSEEGDYRLVCREGDIKHVSVGTCQRFAVMDPAGTQADQNTRSCYTVIQVWDVTAEHEMLLVHQYRAQVQAPDAAAAALRIAREYDVSFIGIEKDGLGLGIVQTVKRSGITVKPIKARGSKEARSETAEIRMAAGTVYFPRGAPFLYELEQELLRFPAGEYSDQVDALSHAAMLVHRSAATPAQEIEDPPVIPRESEEEPFID